MKAEMIGRWLLVVGHWSLAAAVMMTVFIVGARAAIGADDVFAPPGAADVRTRVTQWVAERGVTDKATLERIAQEWAFGEMSLPAEEVFDRVIRSLTLADADARKVIEACRDATPIAAWPNDVIPLTDSRSEERRVGKECA